MAAVTPLPQPPGDDPVKVDPKHYQVEFENERVRVIASSTGRARNLKSVVPYRQCSADRVVLKAGSGGGALTIRRFGLSRFREPRRYGF